MDVVVKSILGRGPARDPAHEKFRQPRILPRRLFLERHGLAERRLPRAPAQHAQLPPIKFQRAVPALDPNVVVLPAVHGAGIRLGAFVETADAVLHLHRYEGRRVPRVLAPGWVPRDRVHPARVGTRQRAQTVEMMNGSFDEQRIGDLMPERRAPTSERAAVVREAVNNVVDRPVRAAFNRAFQRLLVLIEAMAHRHRHLQPRIAHLAVNPRARLHRIGDGLLAEYVAPVPDGDVHDGFVVRRRHNHDDEVGFRLRDRGFGVRKHLRVIQAERFFRHRKHIGIEVHRRGRFRDAQRFQPGQHLRPPVFPPTPNADEDIAQRCTHAGKSSGNGAHGTAWPFALPSSRCK